MPSAHIREGLYQRRLSQTLKVIGAGLGRTGTKSLKLALEQLGFGPCHHMSEVFANLEQQVPLWQAAVDGNPEWNATFAGFSSAVDWPTASFYRELHAAYPEAKFILSLRNPDSWLASFGGTIQKLMKAGDQLPPVMAGWRRMTGGMAKKVGVTPWFSDDELLRAFQAHNAAVRATIPARQLLEFDVKDGWVPLCAFLDVPAPAGDFPRTNDRNDFWEGKPIRPD